ncbi:MAG: hypoxanthine phosphoribosyltransferase [Erysipelotrichaceae bacterium]|jgi:hypoxanthine phosphoribosyltransferase|nr:hypoxanthine phosphoribosyltransferase [Erysipelotrichaceae bacterium]MBQ2138120.1 hypoxanthine phosphoribosyltransferase [Erysipelotrichaceae bacterium]MBQ2585081.1 hypoxanthine phosphoribosyltransferase [Erysipelotrichaceae bacterium]MBQ3994491.1 hypoxanthine phosphoribosyltransferase [Erysipelotrichaceae bacterium]MBQ4019194.1 hypoxanthine phosphoribosyltransferase [Erysipelotrichaceae bacterium]
MLADNVEKVLISEEEIVKRCKELGAQISKDYAGKNPMIIGLLKGSVPFMAELIKNIDIDCTIDFMAVSSYSGLESMGDVKIVKDLDTSIKDVNVLVVEDIVDTGKTLEKVKQLLYSKGANDVKVVSLLDKPDRRIVQIEAEYVGFVIPNEFVVGFGLDFNQKYRNLPYVGVLKEECYKS